METQVAETSEAIEAGRPPAEIEEVEAQPDPSSSSVRSEQPDPSEEQKADAAQEATQDPQPDPEPEAKASEEPDPQLAKLSEEIEELKSKIAQAEAEKAKAEAAKTEQKKAARDQWLLDNGILKDFYLSFAPGVEEVDPFTEEGRRALAKFRSDNPELFKGSPQLPKPAKSQSFLGRARKPFRELYKEAIGS